MTTTNIFTRPMTWLSKVVLKAEDQNGDNIQTTTIGAFLAPEYQQRFAPQIARIRALCPTLGDKLRNETQVKRLKVALPAGTVSAVLEGGLGQDNVVQHNGVISIDIDAKDNRSIHDWEALKQAVGRLPYVAYAGISVSSLGIFALIPIADPAKHKQHFNAIVRDFAQMELRFRQEGDADATVLRGLTLDPLPANIASKRFVSYDPTPVWKTEAAVYEDTFDPAATTTPPGTIDSPVLEPRPDMLRGILHRLFDPLPLSCRQPFDLEAFLREHSIEYEARSRQGGTQYIVQCPWHELHSSYSYADSALFQYPDGRIGYKCLHAHCADRSWQDYRAYYDPEAYAWKDQ